MQPHSIASLWSNPGVGGLMNNKYLVVRISALLVLLFSASVYGQDRFANVTIETVAVAGNISMLIAVSYTHLTLPTIYSV